MSQLLVQASHLCGLDKLIERLNLAVVLRSSQKFPLTYSTQHVNMTMLSHAKSLLQEEEA